MNVERNLLVLLTLAAVASPALGQVTVPADRQASGDSQSAVGSPASGQQMAPAARQANGSSKSAVASPALEQHTAPAARQANRGSKSAGPATGQQTAPAARQANGGSKSVAAGPAAGQQAASAAGQTNSGKKIAAAVPDFSGVWRHGSLPWFVPPASGPGPVTNRTRRKDNGVSDYGMLVGDYTNPILQPWAAELVKKKGEMSLAGITYPNPSNQCWPYPVPFLFKHMAMEMLQRPDKVVMLFNEDHEVRYVRMNQSHPAKVKPSYHGDAVGHYEGDTLVIDTVGIKSDRPYAMIDLYGTPYTEKLHVVERYRLVDQEAAKGTLERAAKELWRPAGPFAPNYADKYLQVDFTIEDEGTFTTPWTASTIYARDRGEWPEISCAENPAGFHNDKEIGIPHADKADF